MVVEPPAAGDAAAAAARVALAAEANRLAAALDALVGFATWREPADVDFPGSPRPWPARLGRRAADSPRCSSRTVTSAASWRRWSPRLARARAARCLGGQRRPA